MVSIDALTTIKTIPMTTALVAMAMLAGLVSILGVLLNPNRILFPSSATTWFMTTRSLKVARSAGNPFLIYRVKPEVKPKKGKAKTLQIL